MTLFQSLVNNTAILLALSYLYTLVSRHWRSQDLAADIVRGLLFGLVAIGVMLSPMQLVPGLVFDTRSVVISVAGLFCGPVSAAVAAALVICYRISLGGVGVAPGIATAISSAAIGSLFFYWRKRRPRPDSPLFFYLFGLLVHVAVVVAMFTLPRDLAWQTVQHITLPVMVVYPLATFFLCLLIADQQQRMRAEQQLAISEERFRTLFDQAADAIYLSDFDGRLVDVNAAAQQVLGYSRQELLRMRVQDVDPEVPDRAALQELWQQRFQDGAAATFESVHRRKDGTTFPVEIRAGFIGHCQPCLVMGVARDISERIQAEEQRRELEEQLMHAQKMEAVGTLAGGIAHEFNNILAAIVGYAELALSLYRRDGITRPEHLQEILNSGKRASELIKRILAFSRKAEMVDFHPFDVNKKLASVVGILEKTIPREIRIITDFAPDTGYVNGDVGQLEQVVMNLATNAKDAMPDGGQLTIKTARVTIAGEPPAMVPDLKPGTYVRLTVADSGHGMDADTQQQVFNPFFTTKDVGAGTGLGLSVVYGIIKGHHGCIGCRSIPGQGTTFQIFLPVAEQRVVVAPKARASQPLLGGHNETVLLVDDEESLRDIGEKMLVANGYQVLLAGSGEEAVEIYRARQDDIDLVLLDVSMPGMGGHRCLATLLKIKPEAKVLVSSGYAVDASLQEVLDEGAVGFVAKPFTMTDLLAAIHRALAA